MCVLCMDHLRSHMLATRLAAGAAALCATLCHLSVFAYGPLPLSLPLSTCCAPRWVWKWHQHYDPALDAEQLVIQRGAAALQKAKQAEYQIKQEMKPAGAAPDAKPNKDTGSAANV